MDSAVLKDIKEATKGRTGIRVVGPISKEEALAEVAKWDRDRMQKEQSQVQTPVEEEESCIAKVRDGSGYHICGRTNGVVMTPVGPLCQKHAATIRKEEDKSCIARKRNGSMCGSTERVQMTLLGPLCHEHAAIVKKDKEESCMARNKDGSKCGSTDQVEMTLLGPLCRKHAAMCNIQEPEREDAQISHSSEPKAMTKRKSMPRSVASLEEDREGTSPEEGIALPSKRESLQKDKRGLFSVVALRTFTDEDMKDQPAGSVWLSLDRASQANEHGGEMKIFDATEDIFENIISAKAWIEEQVNGVDVQAQLDAEAEARWQQVQERARRKKKEMNDSASASVSASNGQSASTRRKSKKSKTKTSSGEANAARGQKPPTRVNKEKEDDTEEDSEEDGEESDGCDDSEGPSRRFRKSRRKRGSRRGGLRSGAVKMLDKQQKRVEDQLFPDDAEEVCIYEECVPDIKLMQKIPLPGKAQALTTGKDAGHVLSFSNDMKAMLSEKTFKSFDAFSLADLMEFQQTVHYVASYQKSDRKDVTDSVVEAVNVIVSNAVSMHATMRDSNSLGPYGENFRAYTYIQVMYLIMFREAFEGTLPEMVFSQYASKFAVKAQGCPGMAPWKDPKLATNAEKAKSKDRCLLCGKSGHRADSDVHKAELAEGSVNMSSEQLSAALANIAKDSGLNAEQKRSWSERIRAFWRKKLQNETVNSAAL